MDELDRQIEQHGIQFGKYHLIAKLAVGGMAELFIAKQSGLARFSKKVAIKCILPYFAQKEEFVTMFLDEARVASHLNHPNVVQIYDIGECEGVYFMAMEYIPGQNLKGFRKRLVTNPEYKENTPYWLLASIFAQAATGLEHIHNALDEHGQPLHLVHRDISPNNIMISSDGVIKIVDFGVAKARTQEHETEVGVLKGRLSYMSPEHLSGQPIDHRSDLFALAVVLYEMTTGKRLFKRKTEAETIQALLTVPIPPPSRIRPDYPPMLEAILLRALNRNPDDRYQTTREFREELEAFLDTGERMYGVRHLASLMEELFSHEIKREKKGTYPLPVTQNDLFNLSRGSYRRIMETGMRHYNASYSTPGSTPSGTNQPSTAGSALMKTSSLGSPFQVSASGFFQQPDVASVSSNVTSALRETASMQGSAIFDEEEDEATTITPSSQENLISASPEVKAIIMDEDELSSTPTNYIGKPKHSVEEAPSVLEDLSFSVEDDNDESFQHSEKKSVPKWVFFTGFLFIIGIAVTSWFLYQRFGASTDQGASPPSQKAITAHIDEQQYLQAATLLEKFKQSDASASSDEWIQTTHTHIQQGLQLDLAQKLYQMGNLQKSKETFGALSQRVPLEELFRRFPQAKPLRDLLTQLSPIPPHSPSKRPPPKKGVQVPTPRRAKPRPALPPSQRTPSTRQPHRRKPIRTRRTPTRTRRTPTRTRRTPTRTRRTRPPARRRTTLPFSSIQLAIRLKIEVYRKGSDGGRIYTKKHANLCRQIEYEVSKVLGRSVRGITNKWKAYVKKRFATSTRSRFVFYPRAVAFVIHRDITKGKSKSQIAQTLISYQKRYRFGHYKNR